MTINCTYDLVQIYNVWIVLFFRSHRKFQSQYVVKAFKHLHSAGYLLLIIRSFFIGDLLVIEFCGIQTVRC